MIRTLVVPVGVVNGVLESRRSTCNIGAAESSPSIGRRAVIALCLVSLMLAGLPGCATPPIEAEPAAAASMTLEDAKDIILRGRMWIWSDGVANPQITIEFAAEKMYGYRYWTDGRHDRSEGCPYEEFQPYVDPYSNTVGIGTHKGSTMFMAHAGCEPDNKSLIVSVSSMVEAKNIAAALLRFKNSTLQERQTWQQQRQQQFEKIAADYRANRQKFQEGENIHRARVMALSAVKEKHNSAAVAMYEDALKQAPWWPEGQFNAALLLGQLRYYGDAIDHMKKYLALVPEAPNARAAQDKIYEWEIAAKDAGYVDGH